jgi:hypothetical protein
LMSTHNKDELKRAARLIAAIVNRYKKWENTYRFVLGGIGNIINVHLIKNGSAIALLLFFFTFPIPKWLKRLLLSNKEKLDF